MCIECCFQESLYWLLGKERGRGRDRHWERETHREREREMRMNVKENERKKTDQSIKELPRVVVAELAAAATAAKLLQSCLTLCSPIDGNPPGSPVPGILQARTLEWVAISFSRQNWLHTYIFIAQPV